MEPDDKLRSRFPAIYTTYYSIVIALAVEMLLSRLRDMEGLGVASSANLLIWTQSFIVIVIAANSWYITVHWVFTNPWRFAYFDAISPLITLMVLAALVSPIGGDVELWFLSLGLYLVVGITIYAINVLRALGYAQGKQQLAQNSGAFVSAILIAVAPLVIGLFAQPDRWSTPLLIGANAVFALLTLSYAVLDRRSRLRAN